MLLVRRCLRLISFTNPFVSRLFRLARIGTIRTLILTLPADADDGIDRRSNQFCLSQHQLFQTAGHHLQRMLEFHLSSVFFGRTLDSIFTVVGEDSSERDQHKMRIQFLFDATF